MDRGERGSVVNAGLQQMNEIAVSVDRLNGRCMGELYYGQAVLMLPVMWLSHRSRNVPAFGHAVVYIY